MTKDHTWWLKTTELCPLTILEAGRPESKCLHAGHVPLKPEGRAFLPLPSSGNSSIPWLVVDHSSQPLSAHSRLPSVSLLVGTTVISGIRAHPAPI